MACNKLVVSTIIYPELKDINYVYSNFDKEQLKMCILQLSQMNDAWFEKYSNHRETLYCTIFRRWHGVMLLIELNLQTKDYETN